MKYILCVNNRYFKIDIDDALTEMRRLINEQEQTTKRLHQRLDDIAKARMEQSE